MLDSLLAAEPESRTSHPGAFTSSSWNPPPASGPPPPVPPPPRHFSLPPWAWLLLVILWSILQGYGLGYRTRRWNKHIRPVRQHEGALAKVSQLHGEGRIYLVQVGEHKNPYQIVELATWLRDNFAVDTQLLPAMPLDQAAYDPDRKQYVAERIDEQLKRTHADLAADPNAFLIGITDEAMYSVTEQDLSTFSWRDERRTAIISSDGLKDDVRAWDGNVEDTPETRSQHRLRRILLKDVAVLFWHLPMNNDPASVLYYTLNPELRGETLYQSDLDPMHSQWGQFFRNPCLVFTHQAGTSGPAAEPTASTPLLRDCLHPESAGEAQAGLNTPENPPDLDQERMEVRLLYGQLTEKHTDFFLPGPIPIRLERATSNDWQMPGAFGMSGSHNYDRYMVSHDGMRHIEIASAGVGDVDLERQPSWLSSLFLNRWTDTDYSGSTLKLRWWSYPERFDLTRYNGEVDSYMPCEDADLCYLNGYKNAQGELLGFQRDASRNLQVLNAPGNNWLHFTHDARTPIQVTEIADSKGRRVRYAYNPKGQLASVSYPTGELLSYEYNDRQELLAVKAKGPDGIEKTLMTNTYDKGRIASQTLTDGKTYRYLFWDGTGQEVRWAQVTTPDGTIFVVGFGPDGAAVKSHLLGEESQSPPLTPARIAQLAATSLVAG